MKTKIAAAVLTLVGVLQMSGDVAGWTPLRALGAATHASPAPKVFTSQGGYETFSARFFIEWHGVDGRLHVVELTPEIYLRLRGPYNRRNAYGAALSYGPVLAANPRTRPMLEQVTRFAFCGDAPLLRELGIEAADPEHPLRVRLEPRDRASRSAAWQTTFDVHCSVEKEAS